MLFLIKVMIQIIFVIFMPHHRIINFGSRYRQPELVFRIDGNQGRFIQVRLSTGRISFRVFLPVSIPHLIRISLSISIHRLSSISFPDFLHFPSISLILYHTIPPAPISIVQPRLHQKTQAEHNSREEHEHSHRHTIRSCPLNHSQSHGCNQYHRTNPNYKRSYPRKQRPHTVFNNIPLVNP